MKRFLVLAASIFTGALRLCAAPPEGRKGGRKGHVSTFDN